MYKNEYLSIYIYLYICTVVVVVGKYYLEKFIYKYNILICMVSLFGFELKKKTPRTYSLEDPEVQEVATATRRNNSIQKALYDLKMDEIAHLKKLQDMRHNEETAQILEGQYKETLQHIYGDDEEDEQDDGEQVQTPESMFMQLVNNVMTKTKPQQTQINNWKEEQAPAQQVELSEEQIKEYLKQIPATQLAIVKSYDVDTQKGLIKEKIPNISDASVNKIINLIS